MLLLDADDRCTPVIQHIVELPDPGITASDRAWAVGLATAARERDVACHPVHLANDQEVRAFAPDDEIASA